MCQLFADVKYEELRINTQSKNLSNQIAVQNVAKNLRIQNICKLHGIYDDEKLKNQQWHADEFRYVSRGARRFWDVVQFFKNAHKKKERHQASEEGGKTQRSRVNLFDAMKGEVVSWLTCE